MKHFLKIVLLLLILLFSITTVFSHPGRTDAKGGHHDTATGDYHYHHGYSAHSHYDVDGDGIIDCPYDFDDKTSSNSSSTSNSRRKYQFPDLEDKVGLAVLGFFILNRILLGYVWEPLYERCKKFMQRFQKAERMAFVASLLLVILLNGLLIYLIVIW